MSRIARRLALGVALAAAITLVPVRPAAADTGEVAASVADLWQSALDWIAEVLGSGGSGPAASTEACRGDEGVCIDPNG